ncbi:Embryonic poly(A)-binding protein 2 [Intoshia linei]|uniref:Embryonic poly(A)-binding protein 2 n=1 Tax=Intoshia linei TaxID=1819745 RepID=A0A177AZC2_9BILA|nr:Embryonic poly(A)-binding protein 2 [Intoshia linei]
MADISLNDDSNLSGDVLESDVPEEIKNDNAGKGIDSDFNDRMKMLEFETDDLLNVTASILSVNKTSNGPSTPSLTEKDCSEEPSPATGDNALPLDEKQDKIEVDSRSVYVGNVDYGATADELELHFHGCGSINRVTIMSDKNSGHPKGFAYVEFESLDGVETANALDSSLFRGRIIKVLPKRTNVPNNSTPRFRGYRSRGRGGSYRGRYRSRGRFNSRGNFNLNKRRFRRARYYQPY